MELAPEQQIAEMLKEAHERSTSLGDGALCWQEWAGPAGVRPVLLLHGGFGSWTHWVSNIRQLRESRTVWTLDMPGLGSSADMLQPYTVSHFAQLILRSLDTLYGVECEFDVVGFSFGALVGSHLATMARARCKHFVGCGAAGFGDLHVQVDLQRPPLPATPTEEARDIHRGNLHKLMLASKDAINDLAIYLHGDNLARARFNSRRLSGGSEFVSVMPQIEARLCGIWGSEDATAGGLGFIEQRRTLMQHSQPDCAFHILDGIGHWAMYEDPATFNRLVIEELDS